MATCSAGAAIPGACPRIKVHVDWQDWALVNLAWPLGALLVLSVIFCFVLNPLHHRLEPRIRSFRIVYVGEGKDPPKRPDPFIALCCLQMLSSMVNLVVWVMRTYQLQGLDTNAALTVATVVDIIAWLWNRFRGEFRWGGLWEINSIVNLLTIVPDLVAAASKTEQWLTLHFLSIYIVLFCFNLIQKTGYFQYNAVLVQMGVRLALQLLCVVTVMAGIVFTLEVLGDPQFLADSYVEIKAGDAVSFFQMVYFIVVSITTVGYGDFAPTTVLSRGFMTFAVVLGVISIYVIQYNFTEAWRKQREGSGRYRKSKSESHIVAVLCMQGHASKLSSLVLGFLEEILHGIHIDPEYEEHHGWPNIVLFSPRHWADETEGTFENFLDKHKFFTHARRQRIQFIVGDISSMADMERVSMGTSKITFLFSDMESSTPDEDDTQTIFVAKILQNKYPQIRLRVMLLSPDSKELAVQAGLEVTRCFATREIKANMLAQNVHCHGFLPTLMMMLKSVDQRDEYEFVEKVNRVAAERGLPLLDHHSSSRPASPQSHPGEGGFERFDDEPVGPWFMQYLAGLQKNLYGFELAEEYAGVPFGEVAQSMFVQSRATLIAFHDGNALQLCPQTSHRDKTLPGQICFAIADNFGILKPFRRGAGSDWRLTLARLRDLHRTQSLEEGPHRAAIKVVAHKVKDSLTALWSQDQISLLANVNGMNGLPAYMMRSRSSIGSLARASISNPNDATGVSQLQLEKSQLQLARDLRKMGEDLVVLVVCRGSVWPQIVSMISCLQASYLPSHCNVVVISPEAPPANVIEQVGHGDATAFLTGSCLSMNLLLDAGIMEASSVVVMTGDGSTNLEGVICAKDLQALLCAEELECWCGISTREVFTTYELRENWSLKQLPPLMTKAAISLDKLVRDNELDFNEDEENDEDDVEGLDDEEEVQTPGGHQRTAVKRLQQKKEVMIDGSNIFGDDDEEESVLLHPRFAAGQVFTPELWGVMLGKMYYMPAVIELVESLVMPHRRNQSAFLWQIRVPPDFFDCTMKQLFTALTVEGLKDPAGLHSKNSVYSPQMGSSAPRCSLASQMSDPSSLKSLGSQEETGLQREISGLSGAASGRRGSIEQTGNRKLSTASVVSNTTSLGNDRRQPREGPAVPIALYRARTDTGPLLEDPAGSSCQWAQGTGGHHYAVLSPVPETVLRKTDWVLVLGSRRFGRTMHRMGLLRGGKPGEEASDTAAARRRSWNDAPRNDAPLMQTQAPVGLQEAPGGAGLHAAEPSKPEAFSPIMPHAIDV
eukprot:TRINITY_DN36821_c0_g1_i1.p1 TRINITY_DN36821_c0_g1~~TRINITY_DN36821_c0_g1_i1.p1  ORF type:complete len:1281 (+),score=194.53 TRINITY_DN36821_c0_g1_i1:55-3897(+)